MSYDADWTDTKTVLAWIANELERIADALERAYPEAPDTEDTCHD